MSEYVSTVANEMVDPMALVLQEVRDTDTNSDFSELNEVPVGRPVQQGREEFYGYILVWIFISYISTLLVSISWYM